MVRLEWFAIQNKIHMDFFMRKDLLLMVSSIIEGSVPIY
jgi:hypothetical protein